MKKLSTITIALLMIAGTFTSCTKDLDEVCLNAALSQDAKGVKATNDNKKIDGGLVITITPQSPMVNQEVTVTASLTESVTTGTLRIDKLGADGITWTPIVTNALTSSVTSVSHKFTSPNADSHTFRGFYTPTGGSNFSQAQTEPATVTFTAACVGANLTAELVDKKIEEGYTLYTVEYTFNSCVNINNAKIQGGLTAFTTLVSAVAKNSIEGSREATAIGNDESNSKISWQLGNIASGYSNTFTITFKNSKKNQEGEITGSWSVEGTNDAGEKVEVVAAPVTVN